MSPIPKKTLASLLARAFLAGEQDFEKILARSVEMLGRPWRWLNPVARRYLRFIADRTRPTLREATHFVFHDRAFHRAWLDRANELSIAHWIAAPQHMQPVAAARPWDVPAIESIAALADWLWLEYGQLDWFADLKRLGAKNPNSRLSHYHYGVLSKGPGAGIRILESPKPSLKKLQRQILTEILEKIPPHPAAHGFVKGRSIKTFATAHAGKHVVVRLDLRNFFVSISHARVEAIFRTMGYPESVATLLAGLCCNSVPRRVCQDPEALLYFRPHLPQGAPTSPALANICAFRADCRLAGLANSAGGQYTRYADDLAFSGDDSFLRVAERFSIHATAILLEEGFTVNTRKTRFMRRGVRQHLAGVVTNEHLNVPRPDFDRLKAILNNCVRHGPESQNRAGHPAFREHLEGRIAYMAMINPAKAERLRVLFKEIDWPTHRVNG